MKMSKRWMWAPLLACLVLPAVPAGCDRDRNADNVVARFEGGLLTMEDLAFHRRKMGLESRFRQQPGMLEPRNVFDHAVNMELVIAKGLKEKLHLDPRIRGEIHAFMADLFLKTLQDRLVPKIDKQSFTEEEVRTYFDAHPEVYRGQDFEARKAYVRNDLLYARYRDAWQTVYDRLKAEFELKVEEEKLARFLEAAPAPTDTNPRQTKEAG